MEGLIILLSFYFFNRRAWPIATEQGGSKSAIGWRLIAVKQYTRFEQFQIIKSDCAMFQFCSAPKFVVVPGMLIVIDLEWSM